MDSVLAAERHALTLPQSGTATAGTDKLTTFVTYLKLNNR